MNGIRIIWSGWIANKKTTQSHFKLKKYECNPITFLCFKLKNELSRRWSRFVGIDMTCVNAACFFFNKSNLFVIVSKMTKYEKIPQFHHHIFHFLRYQIVAITFFRKFWFSLLLGDGVMRGNVTLSSELLVCCFKLT